ncbi:MAG TPA: hypothetical protein VFK13_07640 [Gemmatimonadaceae bacterium]|nr:hypothetical protein [Gemmatimonadaceae bacterium]
MKLRTELSILLVTLAACAAPTAPAEYRILEFCQCGGGCHPIEDAVIVIDGKFGEPLEALARLDQQRVETIEILAPLEASERHFDTAGKWAMVVTTR